MPKFHIVGTILTFLLQFYDITFASSELSPVDYIDAVDSTALRGYLAIPPSASTIPPGIIIILPDWDGVNSYEKERATMVAHELGYAAFAADIYGVDLQNVDNFFQQIQLATKYRETEGLFVSRINAAVDAVKDLAAVNGLADVNDGKVGIVGYCLGGTGVLLYALSEADPSVKALVSVHGGLLDKFSIGPNFVQDQKLLVLSGGEDDTATDILDLEATMDDANAEWEITRYSGIEHGFTKWDADAYDAWADMRSWGSMSSFLQEIFETEPDGTQPLNTYDAEEVDYIGTTLRGYLSTPSSDTTTASAVIIIPDLNDSNDSYRVINYELKRATMLADEGFVAFVADISGLSHDSSPTEYVSRIQETIDTLKTVVNNIDSNRIAIIGYGFGGSGVLHYSLSGSEDVALGVSFHGQLKTIPSSIPETTSSIFTRVLILSGRNDENYGNQTSLEEALDEKGGEWEITRYAGVGPGFTVWDGPSYDAVADGRSWDAMLTLLEEVFDPPSASPTSNPTHPPSASPSASPTSNPIPSGATSVRVGHILYLFVCISVTAMF
jgi:dienelactone hydrolase